MYRSLWYNWEEVNEMADSVQHEKIVLTYEDYITLPNDRNRYEILEGELAVTPSPSFSHQRTSRNLEFILFNHIKAGNLGEIINAPMDVILDNSNIVQPDLVFIKGYKAGSVSARGIEGSPELLVEILSHSTARYDRVSKMQVYARYGVKWYWIVDPQEKTLEEYRNENGSFALIRKAAGEEDFIPSLFPDLTVPLSQVWG